MSTYFDPVTPHGVFVIVPPGGRHEDRRTAPRYHARRSGGDEYIQHNPLAPNGFDAFVSFVESFTTAFPDAHIDIRRVFAECDFVITHALATGAVPVYTERGTKLVDIFRLDRNGRIVEHWDVGAAISATSANGNPEV
jgi:predicted SnoaL-like aldol condensation-catalyzing enzyme